MIDVFSQRLNRKSEIKNHKLRHICSENIIRPLTKINASNFFTPQRKTLFLELVCPFGFH
jgi:hypothetical protein